MQLEPAELDQGSGCSTGLVQLFALLLVRLEHQGLEPSFPESWELIPTAPLAMPHCSAPRMTASRLPMHHASRPLVVELTRGSMSVSIAAGCVYSDTGVWRPHLEALGIRACGFMPDPVHGLTDGLVHVSGRRSSGWLRPVLVARPGEAEVGLHQWPAQEGT